MSLFYCKKPYVTIINDPSLNANNENAPKSFLLPATTLLMGLGLTGLIRRKSK